MDCEKTAAAITQWMEMMALKSGRKGFVVGVSGGVDSGLVSTLAARTGLETRLLIMPIHQAKDQDDRALNHCRSLAEIYSNVTWKIMNLTEVRDEFVNTIGEEDVKPLVDANLRSRIRMCALYATANSYGCMVAGTGNLIEDMGISFFTKGGDGMVDISPIGKLNKTQVRALARHLRVSDEITNAIPTDGLWEDGRSDEDQIGCSYESLEKCMEFCELFGIDTHQDYLNMSVKMVRCETFHNKLALLNEDALAIYLKRHEEGTHKMQMPPVGPDPIM